jgi:deazaflavin-dependent oxidoreductase (nitroreductase family)
LYLSDLSIIVVILNPTGGTTMAGSDATADAKALRKFKFERRVGRVVMNPLVTALGRMGIHPPLTVELETIGRKSGEPRRVPLNGRPDADGLWVISQHGRRAGWAYNVTADPRVRVRIKDQWRSGTATFVPDDDVVARARAIGGGGKIGGSAMAAGMRALQSDPISVHITFDE